MVDSVRTGESRAEDPSLSERDLELLRLILQENTDWIVKVHNGHVVAIQKVSPRLDTQTLPLWWLRYFQANRLYPELWG